MSGRARLASCAAVAAILCLCLCSCSGAPTPTVSDASSPSPSASTAKHPAVTAAITIAGADVDGQHVSVSGFVSGVVESGGTCTFTLTQDSTGKSLILTSIGMANVSTTTCGTQQEPIAAVDRGSWHVRLSYRSKDAAATSGATEMQVP